MKSLTKILIGIAVAGLIAVGSAHMHKDNLILYAAGGTGILVGGIGAGISRYYELNNHSNRNKPKSNYKK